MPVTINGTSGITDVDGTAAAPALTGTDTDTGIFFPAANTLAFATAGTEDARFDSAGNFGLGVTPSAGYRASIKGNYSSIVGGIEFDNGGGDKTVLGFASATSPSFIISNQSASGVLRFDTNNTERMRLDTSGNLGVGVTSLTEKFEVAGSVNASTASTASFSTGNQRAFMDYVPGSTTARFGHLSGASGSTTGVMAMFTNGSERARIDSSGNMGVGNSSPSSYARFVAQQDVAGNKTGTFLNGASSGTFTNDLVYLAYTNTAPNNSTGYFVRCNDTGADRVQLRNNGGIANYQANDANLSDRKEKTNFAPAGEYLSKICAIPVQTFNYIDQNMEDDPGTTLGVVAQDVQAVAPELVMESNWGTKEEPKMRLSIYQTDLQYALMKCIQEQQAIIEQLKADVAALKGQ